MLPQQTVFLTTKTQLNENDFINGCLEGHR